MSHSTRRPHYFVLSRWCLSVLVTVTMLCTNAATAQTEISFLGNEFQRFNIQQFDLKISEPNIKDRMMCERWCDDKIITMMDTLDAKYNLDLSESLFYINMNEKVFTVKSHFIKSFIIDDKTYINYRRSETSEAMILEILVDGTYTLYRHHNLIYRAPDFDPVLNVGNKIGLYKKKYEYYAFCKERLIELPSKVKKAAKKLHQECDIPKGLKVKGDMIDLFNKINHIEE